MVLRYFIELLDKNTNTTHTELVPLDYEVSNSFQTMKILLDTEDKIRDYFNDLLPFHNKINKTKYVVSKIYQDEYVPEKEEKISYDDYRDGYKVVVALEKYEKAMKSVLNQRKKIEKLLKENNLGLQENHLYYLDNNFIVADLSEYLKGENNKQNRLDMLDDLISPLVDGNE